MGHGLPHPDVHGRYEVQGVLVSEYPRRAEIPGEKAATARNSDSVNIDLHTGLLSVARHVPSPNCDERSGAGMDLIVIHGISLPPGEFGGRWIEDLFTNRLDPTAHPYFHQIQDLRVSAHLLIRRDGELVQFVPFHRRAWHAGPSEYRGRPRCNDYSVGIELEGLDEIPYSLAQYHHLAMTIDTLVAAYPGLSRDRIAGHEHISPGRKTDPGPAFDWAMLGRLLRSGSSDLC